MLTPMTKAQHAKMAEQLAAQAVEEDHPEWVLAWAAVAQVHATLAAGRDQAEEIAAAIEETIGGYPGNEVERPKVGRGELLNDADWAARIAREHGKGN